MAFVADCGSSTVLEALQLPTAAVFFVPREPLAVLETRPSATVPRRLHAPSVEFE